MENRVPWRFIILGTFVWMISLVQFVHSCTKAGSCGLGKCSKDKKTCICPKGYWGDKCEKGRLRVTSPSGYLSDGVGKYQPSSKFTWLIDSKKKNRSINIQLESFGTECSWDHLYVFDGRSIYDPLVAVWSGVIDGASTGASKRRVQTNSGAAYVHFYSDQNVPGEGFNISYSISSCANICSSNGFCTSNGKCECYPGWIGKNCGTKVCCRRGFYNLATDKYECKGKLYGSDCPAEVRPRASHAAVEHENAMWIFGGVSFKRATNELLRYDFLKKEWREMKATNTPSPRDGHTMVYHNNHLVVYGGHSGDKVSNEVWRYSIEVRTWTKVKTTGDAPLPLVGHASVVVGAKMYSLLGFSSTYSFVRNVQQFNLATSAWKIVKTRGIVMCGTYGHSAVYDAPTNLIYVHGGYAAKCSKLFKDELFDGLFTFNPTSKKWSALEGSGFARMLHSATILGRLMVVYGGYIHNGTHYQESKKKCHSNDVLVYNLECKKWIEVKADTLKIRNTERYGHTAVSWNRSIHVFGGFNGVFKNDIVLMTLGDCSTYTSKNACLESPQVSNCVWKKTTAKCVLSEAFGSLPASQIEKKSCGVVPKNCASHGNCDVCTSAGCTWCSKSCNSSCDGHKGEEVTVIEKCNKSESAEATCTGLATCFSCESHVNCTWNLKAQRPCSYTPGKSKVNASAACADSKGRYLCSQFKDCSSCGNSNLQCMWCESQQRCFNTNAYIMNFPYGQCHEWANKKSCEQIKCEQLKTCQNCFELPGCGWCNDPSMTGIGRCMKGTDSGPYPRDKQQCPASLWYFTDCPVCQCNGHSICINGSKCHKCRHNTSGNKCEFCAPGYYGEAKVNGTCRACRCNGHMKSCDRKSGHCQCDAKGVIGNQCERCDKEGDYEGNATKGGFCYYTLKLGFKYTFNMTEKTKINFIARPRKTDRDLEFELDVISGGHLYMNLSVTYTETSRPEHVIVSGYRIGKYKETFAEDDYKFSADAGVPAFKVYLYGWKRGTAFEISFAQRPSLFDLVYFLIVFVVCFCVLLVIMIVMWKLKQLYESYQYNRRREIEMQEMASRPFGCVTISLNGENAVVGKSEPSAVAVETYAHGKAAVLSTFVELPRCASGVAPLGQSGICIASTLVVTNNTKRTLYGSQQKYIYRDKQKMHHGTAVNV